MGDLARDRGIDGRMTAKERLGKERLLLEKERELIQRQASEVRDECQKLRDEYSSPARKTTVQGIKPKQHAVRDFVDLAGSDGYAPLLRDAINFCETHDGCPFFGESCKSKEAAACRGIWIKMGAPCQVFAGTIKRCIKEAIGNDK
jgi:hypothetical protein